MLLYILWALWAKGFVAKGLCGQRALWAKGLVAKGLCGQRALWPKGSVGKGLCGQRALWAKGFVAKGLCGQRAESEIHKKYIKKTHNCKTWGPVTAENQIR